VPTKACVWYSRHTPALSPPLAPTPQKNSVAHKSLTLRKLTLRKLTVTADASKADASKADFATSHLDLTRLFHSEKRLVTQTLTPPFFVQLFEKTLTFSFHSEPHSTP
jgi:hypothetical protein